MPKMGSRAVGWQVNLCLRRLQAWERAAAFKRNPAAQQFGR